MYLKAKDVDNADKKTVILLSSCGASTYQLVQSLTAPSPPQSETYKELLELIQNYFSPKPSWSTIIQRLKFNSWTRL